jgi:uncharacterized protein (DUF1778 family)
MTRSGRDAKYFQKEEALMPCAVESRSERIGVRASPPVKRLLQQAARASHKNVIAFLLEARIRAAQQTLAGRLRFELTPNQWDAFQAALNRPVVSKPRLRNLLGGPDLPG